MRIESSRPSHNGGWLHLEHEPEKFRPLPPPSRPAPTIDAAELMQSFSTETSKDMIEAEANRLGVDMAALLALGIAWAWKHEAFAFPMSDRACNVIGIRLRSTCGKKWAVTGSRQGIFLPIDGLLPKEVSGSRRLYIAEGPTDTAAGLSMGLLTIGRPSCTGGTEEIQGFLKQIRVREVVIISDCDEPGQRGSEKLAQELKVPSCVFTPPCKDIRELLNLGGTKEFVDSSVQNLIWNVPKEN